MRLTIAAILLGLAPAALAQRPSEDALTRGLLNLATMQQLSAALEYQRVVHGAYRLGSSDAETASLLAVDAAQLRDPWGTPYRVELLEKGGYRIAGAGDDKKFDEKSWSAGGQTTSLAADCVVIGGVFARSNRAWLLGFVTEQQKNDQPLPTAFPRGDTYRVVNTPGRAWAWLRINEIESEAMAKDPRVVDALRLRITQDKMKAFSEIYIKGRQTWHSVRSVRSGRVDDEWGTALETVFPDAEGQHVRVVSAGADKRFDRDSWTKAIGPSLDEDLVYDDGAPTRALDVDTLAAAFLPPELQSHPTITKLKTTGGEQIYKVGGDVSAPVVMLRDALPYPPELDGHGKIGIAEVTIDASGKVVGVKPMLGLSADADRMIAEALRRWEFKPATRAGQPVAVIYNVTVSLTPPR